MNSLNLAYEIINKQEQELKAKDEEHERLIKDLEEETEKLRKQIKFESGARKRAIKALKTNTHQVCDKIRKYFTVDQPFPFREHEEIGIDITDFMEFLDQIERGEL